MRIRGIHAPCESMPTSGQGGGNALPSYRQAGAFLFL